MRFSGRTLAATVMALLIVVIAPFVWLRFSNREQQGIRTTTSTTHTDSTITALPAQNSPKATRDTIAAPFRQMQPATAPTVSGSSALIIPVQGVTPDQLVDTYTQARSNGRIHDAIDIMAPHNTPVVAATQGSIVRLFQSKLGGATIYELSPDGHTVYYYAHLDRYADGLTQGQQVTQGQLLGYVGDTGDAGPGNYHLHFAIWLIQDPKKFWDGENIDPYPILRHVK